MADFPINPLLPDEILAKRTSLPLKPDAVILTGQRIRLQPLDLTRDAELLFQRSNGQPCSLGERSVAAYDADALIWRYTGGGSFADVAAMSAWLQVQIDAPDKLALAVYDIATDSPVGLVNLMSNEPHNLSIELGGIWYSPLAQKTGANTEATYLMLAHVFGLGYRRVVWKCHSLNLRSRQSALRFGFQFEGIQEYHMILKGRSRDTAWFRMLDREWDSVRPQLESRLKALYA